MKLVWYLKKEEYEKFQKEQQNFDGSDNGEREYIGSVRTGELCFDILSCGDKLFFDLYVGGVNTGYGYSYKSEYEDFIEDLTKYIEEHIRTHEGYVTDFKAIPVSLIEKADAELKLW